MSANVYSEETDTQPSIYRSYLRLDPPPQRTVRALLRNGNKNSVYYTVFDEDAMLAADSIYSTHSVIKNSPMISHPKDLNRKVSIQYLPLSEKTFVSLLKNLIFDYNYKVEVYSAENEKAGWKLFQSASPGHLDEIEDLLYSEANNDNDSNTATGNSFDVASSSIIAALKLVSNSKEGKRIGLAFYDPNSKFLGLSEYPDTDLFSNTESILIQLGVKECLISSSFVSTNTSKPDLDVSRLTQTIDRCDILITPTQSSTFNSNNSDQDFITLSGNDHILATSELASLTVALQSSNSLINYLSLLGNSMNHGNIQIGKYDLDKYMRLDSAAVKALNLFPPIGSSSTNINTNGIMSSAPTSIFALLNQCKSAGGSRLLSQWIKQPLIDIEEINNRHLLVEWFVNNSSFIGDIRHSFLNSVPDISRLIRKLVGKKGSGLDEVVRLYQLVKNLNTGIDLLENSSENLDAAEDIKLIELINEFWLDGLKKYENVLKKFKDMIEQTIDLESLENATSASFSSSLIQINPQYDDKLLQLKNEREMIENEIKDLHEEASLDLNMEIDKKLKLEQNVNHGWCFRLTRIDSNVLRGKSSSLKSKNSKNSQYQELQTVKAGVFFTTIKLTELSNKYNDVMTAYSKQQSTIVSEIRSISATYAPIFTKLGTILDTLDVITSFASVASCAPIEFVKPKKLYSLNDPDRKMRVWQGRHPCLEVTEGVSFIPNDYVIGGPKNEKITSPNGVSWDSGKDFYLITGPNMGGKSTYIRTLGVICLMNQIGSFIPCMEDSEIAIVDAIHARVGASDSQLKGVSTFMAEMLEMSSILASAHEGSLVIVDELGRGTSTYDGFGLAWSISEHLAKDVKSWTLFATHFHELTTLANEHENIGNLHVVAHVDEGGDNNTEQENVVLLYKVEPGISDKSFGIHVAELVKFPQKIISMAKRKASELDDDNDDGDDKRSKKLTKEEYGKNRENLKKILKDWKSKVVAAGGLEAISSDKAVEILRSLVADSDRADLSETLSL